MTRDTTIPGASGKIILCGEHFVMHGAPAIAIPMMNLGMRLESGEPSARDPRLLSAWNAARGELGLDRSERFPFHIRSDIPVGYGLGSSAAIAVALIRAAAVEAERSLDPRETARRAVAVEDVFHGRSSGLDPAVVALEIPIRFQVDGTVEPLAWRLEGTEILVARTATAGDTAEAVRLSRGFAAREPARFQTILAEAVHLTDQVAGAMTGAPGLGPVDAGTALSQFHRLLGEIGVSCEALDGLVEAAEGAGALGAKLTGAGLGGCVVALVESEGSGDMVGTLKGAGAVELYGVNPLPVVPPGP